MLIAAYVILRKGIESSPLTRVLGSVTIVPGVVLGAWAISGFTRMDLAEKFKSLLKKPSTPLFLGLVCAFVFLFSAWMAIGPLGGIPRGGDETAYLFQSRILARGQLTAPEPPVPDPRRFFPFRHFIFDDGRWFIMYTPLHAALMAPFTAAGAHSLFGPVEGALSILGSYLLLRRLAGPGTARLATLLMALSPFFLFMSATRMAHNTTLCLVVWACWAFVSGLQRNKVLLSSLGGLLLGLAVNAKPYPDIAWWPFALAAIAAAGGRLRWRHLAAAVAGGIPAAALLLATNWYYTGDPLTTAYNLARGQSLIGFGPDKAWYPIYGDNAHTPLRGLLNVAKQAGAGSVILFGWPLVSFVPALFSLRAARRDRRILWPFCLLIGFAFLLFLHYSPSVDYGPRHYFSLVTAAVFLSAIGLGEIAAGLRAKLGSRGGSVTALSAAGLFLASAAFYVPNGISERSGAWMAIDDEPMRLAEERATPPALVFMQASEHGYPNIISGLNYDSPYLDSPFLFCAHQSFTEDLELTAALPGRSAYLFWFDETGSHLEPWTLERAVGLTESRNLLLDISLPRGAPDS